MLDTVVHFVRHTTTLMDTILVQLGHLLVVNQRFSGTHLDTAGWYLEQQDAFEEGQPMGLTHGKQFSLMLKHNC